MGILLTDFNDYFNKNQIIDSTIINKGLHILDESTRGSDLFSASMNRSIHITSTFDSILYYISDSYMRLTGYTKSEILSFGNNFINKIIHPSDKIELENMRILALQEIFTHTRTSRFSHHSICFNYRIKHKSGFWLTLECNAYPCCFLIDKPRFFIGIVKSTRAFHKQKFQIYFPKDNARYVFNRRNNKFISEEKVRLKSNELVILDLTAKGYREHEIAKKLETDVNNIKYYKKGIMHKLSVHSMPEAIYYALKHKLI
ncbi:MAG: LuxR C-terminal-related transcriptional regulator [Tannerellaceae bacterium]